MKTTAQILLVDDNMTLCNALRKSLSHEGFDILTTLSGEEALGFVLGNLFHLIVVDLKLPKMNGLEFIDRLRAMGCKAPVMMITAYGSEEVTKKAKQSGILKIIPKSSHFLIDLKQSIRLAKETGQISVPC